MDTYSSWQLTPTDFPSDGTTEEQLRFLARFGILAPSVHNTQPWRVGIKNDKLIITPNYDRQLKVGDRTGRGLWLSLGSLVENVVLAAEAYGIKTHVELDEHTPAIKIGMTSASGKHDTKLTQAITSRRSNRHHFDSTPPNSLDIKQIANSWRGHEVEVKVVTDRATIELVAGLTKRGIAMALSLPDFKDELAHLIKPSWTKNPEGMPGRVLELGTIGSYFASWRFRHRDVAPSESELESNRILNSGALVLIFSRGDTLKYWFEAGRAYERTAVVATSLGLATSTMAAAVEAPDFHKEIEDQLKTPMRLQSIMRIGVCSRKAPHSPRYSLEQVWDNATSTS